MITDEEILNKFIIRDKNNRLLICHESKMTEEEKNYLNNRFNDSQSINESIKRIYFHIEEKPKCPICGKPVKWLGKEKRLMLKTCSSECGAKLRYESTKKTNLIRYGVENCFQSPEKIQKIKNTWIKNYGVDHPQKSKIIKEKIKETCLKKYGVINGGGSKQALEKIKNTCLKHFNTNTPFKSEIIKEKIKKTNLEKYGVDNPLKNKEIQEKRKKTCIKKYGTEYYFQSERYKKDFYKIYYPKILKTKKKNHTYTSSKAESIIYNKLIKKFNKVICQYRDEQRYPWNCDFYIPEIDCFIEYQGYYSHLDHPFNENNKNDIYILNQYKEKIKNGKKFYKCVLETWAKNDVIKRNFAKKNNLYFIEIWNLNEVDNCINKICK